MPADRESLVSGAYEREAIMDYPTAWAFIRATDPEDHHEKCSWRTQNGALLCDCDVLWDEYERRGGIGDAGFQKVIQPWRVRVSGWLCISRAASDEQRPCR